jgi:hypothetical protein
MGLVAWQSQYISCVLPTFPPILCFLNLSCLVLPEHVNYSFQKGHACTSWPQDRSLGSGTAVNFVTHLNKCHATWHIVIWKWSSCHIPEPQSICIRYAMCSMTVVSRHCGIHMHRAGQCSCLTLQWKCPQRSASTA